MRKSEMGIGIKRQSAVKREKGCKKSSKKGILKAQSKSEHMQKGEVSD